MSDGLTSGSKQSDGLTSGRKSDGLTLGSKPKKSAEMKNISIAFSIWPKKRLVSPAQVDLEEVNFVWGATVQEWDPI